MPIPPEKIDAKEPGQYLEIMTRAAFQAGLSWKQIDSKWENFRKAFHNFDCQKVSSMTDDDVERLAQDEGIIRSRAKIQGTIDNARTLLELESAHGSIRNYLRSFETYRDVSADLRKRFKHLGELSIYYLLFLVGEEVPPFEEWSKTIPGKHPRMREMVIHNRGKL